MGFPVQQGRTLCQRSSAWRRPLRRRRVADWHWRQERGPHAPTARASSCMLPWLSFWHRCGFSSSLLASPSLILIAGRGKKAEAEQGHGCRVTLWSGGGGRGYQRVVFLRSTSCDVGQDLPILVSLLTCLLAHMKPQLVALRAACQVHSAL